MTKGVTTDLSELIALARFARAYQCKPRQSLAFGNNHLSPYRGRGMDFSEVRNYQAGDEIRHMEWRVTARTGKPHIKLYQEEREQPVMLLVDFSPSMYFGTQLAFKSVLAARLSALIAWSTIQQGDWIGGLLFSATRHHEYIPRGREKGVLTLLAGLCEYTQQIPKENQAGKSLEKALQRLNRVARPGSVIVLVSDFYQFNANCVELLTRLRPKNEILAYHVFDPVEMTPPPPEHYAISNGVDELLLNTRAHEVQAVYQQYCNERVATLKQQLHQVRVPYFALSPFDDLPRLVHTTFPRKKNA